MNFIAFAAAMAATPAFADPSVSITVVAGIGETATAVRGID